MIKKTLLASILLGAGALFAQNHEISRETIDTGGGKLEGVQFSLHGTAGQHDASSVVESANYQLSGGFWPGSINEDRPDGLFADGFEEEGQ